MSIELTVLKANVILWIIHAILLVAATNPTEAPMINIGMQQISWLPSDITPSDVNASAELYAESESTGFVAKTVDALSLIPIFGDFLATAFGSSSSVIAIISFMLFGIVIILAGIGLPTGIVFIFAVGVSLLQMFGMFIIFLKIIQAIAGVL